MKKYIILIALFIFSMNVWGQDSVYVLPPNTYFDLWGNSHYVINISKDTLKIDGKMYIHTLKLPKISIRWGYSNYDSLRLLNIIEGIKIEDVRSIVVNSEPDTVKAFVKEIIIPYSEENGKRYFKDYYMALPDTVTKYKYGVWNELSIGHTEKINVIEDYKGMFSNDLQYTGMDDNWTLISKRFDSLEKRIAELEKIENLKKHNRIIKSFQTSLKIAIQRNKY